MSERFLPYGRQSIDDSDIKAVVEVLKSDWLTTGPAVAHFEETVCAFTGAAHAVAVSSGTAALHVTMMALDIGPGDEVIVPPVTFAATSNAVLYCGARPVFADVDPRTLLLDPEAVAAAITPRTRAIVGVDYAGQPCDWDALRALARRHGLALVADACHALGGEYRGRRVGTLADVTVFSFHPVKPVTTGEGGMALTDDPGLAERMRHLRGHGITSTAAQREAAGGWFYEMTSLGYNYRICDIQCALGTSQMARLPGWVERRNALARRYDAALAGTAVRPLETLPDIRHARHLYVVRTPDRDSRFRALRAAGIGVNVHYIPVYLHPYYRSLGYEPGLCPVSEAAFAEILTLPLWPGMEDGEVDRVVRELLS
ncbi:UDP-4-amino-4,6-dideoxy-N-acetyl-beta-L-altrosamine transaminase [Phaeovibrio sulfidiphilus]|uniref:UDP-4-amino-4, 6-dideoxy-N-acetyl-beta-L-altrosamine transaminase n=1 Tax=Phaeovibrio sulfidiphilus TaxID=1220600 RepID=A0A8J6YMQ7_9PROT|nr:UDP-4-amino-4,6-dideoxy-N-acetyl-beta-L-altrosamine transaminase [Phaeovibrio sulfidiphilus]